MITQLSCTFATLVLKPSFSRSISLHGHYSCAQFIFWNFTTRCLAVNVGGRIGECGRLSQPYCWLSGTNSYTYLLTYGDIVSSDGYCSKFICASAYVVCGEHR